MDREGLGNLLLQIGTDYEDKFSRPLELGMKERVTRLQLRLLLYIQGQGMVYMSELSGTKHIAKSQVTAAVQDLVEGGLAERFMGETDRRRVYVRCTAEGEELLSDLQHIMNQFLEEKISRLTGEERAELASALHTVGRFIERL